MIKQPTKSSRASQSGIAMIEVLVTVVVMAIGLLGMAALQVKSVQATNDASQHSQAIWVLEDLAGKIRANPEGAKLKQYEFSDSTALCANPPAVACGSDLISDRAQSSTTMASFCNATQLSAYDTWTTACSPTKPTNSEGFSRTSPIDYLASPTMNVACITNNGTTNYCERYSLSVTWLAHNQARQSASNKREYSLSMEVEVQ